MRRGRHVEVFRSPSRVKILRGVSVHVKLLQQWRWRVVGANGETMAASQAYTRKASAARAARELWPTLPIEVVSR